MRYLNWAVVLSATVALMLMLGASVCTAELIYDDFNDGRLGTNTGGGCGAMSPGGLYDPGIAFEGDAYEGPFSLSLQYSFPTGQWCGYWSAFTAGQTAYDVTPYSRLEMWVRGENGGERFKIELSDIYFDPNNYLETQYHKRAVRIVDAPDGAFQQGLSTQWKKLSLPLSLFRVAPSQLDLSKLKLVNIVFDESPTTGKIYIDAITFVKAKSYLRILPSSQRVGVGDEFTCSVQMEPATQVDFVYFDVVFDPSHLSLVGVEEGGFENGEVSSFSFDNREPGRVRFWITGGDSGISSTRTLATVAFQAVGIEGTTSILVENQLLVKFSDEGQDTLASEVENSEILIRAFLPWDINRDENVDRLDLAVITTSWGMVGTPRWIRADVNADGIIDVSDLVIVAQHIER